LDSFITNLFRVPEFTISNKGPYLSNNLEFEIKINNEHAKIIDIKIIGYDDLYKPTNDLPKISWDNSFSQKNEKHLLIRWSKPQGNVQGNQIYWSKFKEVGYSKISGLKTVPCCEYLLDTTDFINGYYEIDAISPRGLTSEFSPTPIFIKWPNYLEYEDHYNKLDKNTTSMLFNSGIAHFSLPNGLKKHQAVKVFCLYKTSPVENETIDVILNNKGDVEYKFINTEDSHKNLHSKQITIKNKINLTPQKVYYLPGKNGVFLFWRKSLKCSTALK